MRDRALFDLAVDSKLRGCDLVKMKIGSLVTGAEIRTRSMVIQQKTGRPVQFEITADVRASLLAWLERSGTVDDYAFPSRIDHADQALVCVFRREFDMAERHFRRAYQLNPNDANGLVQMGGLLARRGRLDEGLEWINEGMRLNPFPPSWYEAALANVLYLLERYDEAALALSELPNPGPYTHARLAACYAQSHRIAEAHAEVALVLKDRPNFSTADFLTRVVILERPDHRKLLRHGLLKAGLPE